LAGWEGGFSGRRAVPEMRGGRFKGEGLGSSVAGRDGRGVLTRRVTGPGSGQKGQKAGAAAIALRTGTGESEGLKGD